MNTMIHKDKLLADFKGFGFLIVCKMIIVKGGSILQNILQ